MRQRPSNHGFTIIELLVVLATGTLLVSQIVPAADKARDDARRTLCQQRLGEIARAAHAYAAADPHENGIPIGVGDAFSVEMRYAYYGFGGKSGLGLTTTQGEDGRWSLPHYLDAYHRPLNHLLYKRPLPAPTPSYSWSLINDCRVKLDLYHCPGDQGFSGMHHGGWQSTDRSSYNYYGTSYTANALLIGYPGIARIDSNSMYRHPLSNTPNPGNTVFYWENAARFAPWAPNTNDYDQSGCYWSTGLYAEAANQNMVAHGNHGQDWHFNVAFADGHVDFLPVRGYGRTHGLSDELTSNGFCHSYGNGTTCDCILVRGLGWQLDTLPTRPTETNKICDTGLGPLWKDGFSTLYNVVP